MRIGWEQIMAAYMCLKMGWIDQTLFDRTLELTKRARLPISPPGSMDVQTFKDIMAVSGYSDNNQCLTPVFSFGSSCGTLRTKIG
jgi:hypothetical protein